MIRFIKPINMHAGFISEATKCISMQYTNNTFICSKLVLKADTI